MHNVCHRRGVLQIFLVSLRQVVVFMKLCLIVSLVLNGTLDCFLGSTAFFWAAARGKEFNRGAFEF